MVNKDTSLIALTHGESVYEVISERIAEFLPDCEPCIVLDAGCGSATHIAVPASARVIGVDISERQLARHEHIDEALCADLQSVDLTSVGAHLVVCWNVIEHLANPMQAMHNLFGALRPGGVLVVAAPNPMSVKGLVTKLAPHRIHTWYYRSILKKPNAGTEDNAPFPTPMRLAIAPRRVIEAGKRVGIETILGVEYEGWVQRRLRDRGSLLSRMFVLGARAVEALTLGRVAFEATEYALVMRRPEQQALANPAG